MSDKARRMSRIALASVAVGLVLTGMKLVVGLTTGSLGILSEAAHSLLDLGAALLTFFAVRAAVRPPDAQHQYGHGKVENLSAMAQALLLLGTCVWIVYEAVHRIAGGTVEVEASVWAFAVMGVALVLDVVIARVLYAGARRYNSQALEADALHYSSDILSSAVVIAGLVGVRLGVPILDPLAALGVAALVAIASVRLLKRTIDGLLDRAPPGLAERIAEHVRTHCAVRAVERVRVRPSGSAAFVDLIAAVDRGLSLEQSHALSDSVEAEVRKVVPDADVLVHFHPTTAGETPIDAVRTIARRFPEIDDVHDVRGYADAETGKRFLTLHVQLRPELSLEAAHAVVDRLEDAVRAELPEVGEIATHLEASTALGDGRRQSVPPERLQALTAAVLRDERVRDLHDVALHTGSLGTVLTCHLVTRPDLTVEQAHEVTTAVEQRAREVFPELSDVVVHAEPAAS
ncbi:MAG: cation-efflux pump [Deltaproteobacteria bacterium]|nr:cation-efflux pump [Deltaproteobacteria bacterium]